MSLTPLDKPSSVSTLNTYPSFENRCSFIALIVLTIISSTLLALGASSMFGAPHTVGFLVPIFIDSVFTAASITTLMVYAIRNCKAQSLTVAPESLETPLPIDNANDSTSLLSQPLSQEEQLRRDKRAFFEKIKNKHTFRIKECLEKGIDPLTRNEKGITALDYAISTGDLEIVKVLIEALTKQKRAFPKTVLHTAIIQGCKGNNPLLFFRIVRYFVEAGAHLDIRDSLNRTALDCVVAYEMDQKIAEQKRAIYETQKLAMAVEERTVSIFLLKSGATVGFESTRALLFGTMLEEVDAEEALWSAVQTVDLSHLRILITQMQKAVHSALPQITLSSWTRSALATLQRNEECFALNLYCERMNSRNEHGMTLYHFAESIDADLAQFLAENGADTQATPIIFSSL